MQLGLNTTDLLSVFGALMSCACLLLSPTDENGWQKLTSSQSSPYELHSSSGTARCARSAATSVKRVVQVLPWLCATKRGVRESLFELKKWAFHERESGNVVVAVLIIVMNADEVIE